jgi:hypothetical protein
LSVETKINIKIVGKLPITLEGAQLAVNNAERLLNDSKNVSIPTKVALLEIGLEEIAKAWGIILNFEKILFDQNLNALETFRKTVHINRKEYNKKIEEISKSITKFFDENDPESLLIPFNTETFSDHNSKIKFLSTFIKYIREIQLPLLRTSSDRIKQAREILGGYISKNKLSNMKEIDKIIDDILDVDDNQLTYIVNLKEYGLYLDVENDVYLSPSARTFETETLENLLALLIGMAKNEVSLLFIVLGKTKKTKVGK